MERRAKRLKRDRSKLSEMAKLQDLNEYCLLSIVQYLHIIDVVNLGRTCRNLHRFAENVKLSMKGKKIKITLTDKTVAIQLDQTYASDCSLQILKDAVIYFGKFVEEFVFVYNLSCAEDHRSIEYVNIWTSIVYVLNRCDNLKTLRLNNRRYVLDQGRQLQGIIKCLGKLKVLDLSNFQGLTSIWRPSFRSNKTIEKLSFFADVHMSENFIKYFKNVSDICIYNVNLGNRAKITKLLQDYRGLKKLAIYGKANHGYVWLAPILSAHLKNLEHLKIKLLSDHDLYDMPHLKSITISCPTDLDVVLRRLSNFGRIENIKIRTANYGNRTEQPYTFRRLQCLDCRMSMNPQLFIQSMERSETPEIHSITFVIWGRNSLNAMRDLINAKVTIKSVRMEWMNLNIMPLEFWIQLIDILQRPCVPKRTFLNFGIFPYPIESDAVR